MCFITSHIKLSNVSIPPQSNDLAWESFTVYYAYIWISKTENDFSLDIVSGEWRFLKSVGHWFVPEPNFLVQIPSKKKKKVSSKSTR